MKTADFPYHFFPLGDNAITIDFGNYISAEINEEVIARFKQLQQHPFHGMTEAVPAYSSLTVYYDVMALQEKLPAATTVYDAVKKQLIQLLQEPVLSTTATNRLIKIPVCYENEFAPDMQTMAAAKNISAEEIIELHTAGIYKVYMLGFLPGFAYMGIVNEKIAFSRKTAPATVAAGSVGIAGFQTGIYPLASPGGWQIIGRTPLQLFNQYQEEPTLLKAGDNVQFYAINKFEFEQLSKTGI